MERKVKGVLFVDYVRMLKARKSVDWRARLPAEDAALLNERIEADRWYPMSTFEHFGLLILDVVAAGSLEMVRAWGKLSADELHHSTPGLLVEGDPRESFMRFQVMRGSFFDFDAVVPRELSDKQASVTIDYRMGAIAEEAASYQTMGFFERLVEMAGGKDIDVAFRERRWEGAPATILSVGWH